ncbi:MAG TPA: PDZ domain-containing protein [Pirellulales bacterium]|jgi:hypothetical protein
MRVGTSSIRPVVLRAGSVWLPAGALACSLLLAATASAQVTPVDVEPRAGQVVAAPAVQSAAIVGRSKTNRADKPGTATPAQIDQWISQLGSSDFRVRELAMQQLATAGAKAVDPLVKASQAVDVEIAYRAVQVLQSFVTDDAKALKQSAAKALEELATREKGQTAALAVDALAYYHLTLRDEMIVKLHDLGAAIRCVKDDIPFWPDPTALIVVIDSNWSGKSSDFELLKSVPNLQYLQIVNTRLDEKTLQTVSELPDLVQVDLFGTGVSRENVQALETKMPGVKFDRRNGALLGVIGESGSGHCLVKGVKAGTAASDADLQYGDLILSIDGQAVQSFEELTVLIGEKKPNDHVTLEIRRPGEIDPMTKEITLGQWR